MIITDSKSGERMTGNRFGVKHGHCLVVARSEAGRWIVWHEDHAGRTISVPGTIDPTTGELRTFSAQQAKKIARERLASLLAATWVSWKLYIGESCAVTLMYPDTAEQGKIGPRELEKMMEAKRDEFRAAHGIRPGSPEFNDVRLYKDGRRVL